MSKELLNKAIASCFAKIARVDGSIGKEELDIINSSEILKNMEVVLKELIQKISLTIFRINTARL